MKKIQKFVLFGLILAGCGGTNYLRPSQGAFAHIEHVAIVVNGEPDFKVLDSRATDLGPGVLFGAIGAIANSAYTNSKDATQEKELKPQTSQISYRETFVDQIKKFLQESKRFSKIDFYEQSNLKDQSVDAVLELSICEWGIRLINRQSSDLVPFITVEIRLTDSKGKVLWKERDVEVGHSGHSVAAYRTEENLLKDSLHAVLKDTAYRIVSTLIYS